MATSIRSASALILVVLLGGCARVDLAAVEVTVEAPARLAVGESAVWRVLVVNRGRAAIPIQDLDVSEALLAGVVLQEESIQPPLQGASRTVVGYLNLPLGVSLQPGEPLDIHLPVTARALATDASDGRFGGDIDVSIDNFRVKTTRVSYVIPSAEPAAAMVIETPAAPPAIKPEPSSDALPSADAPAAAEMAPADEGLAEPAEGDPPEQPDGPADPDATGSDERPSTPAAPEPAPAS